MKAIDSISKRWNIEKRLEEKLIDKSFPAFSSNVGLLPKNFETMLAGYKKIISPTDDSWFLMLEDYYGISDSAYSWNEFENQSLDAALDNDDKLNVQNFWRFHLPFFISLKSGYSFFAICFEKNNFGAIVFGQEPEYELVENFSTSFDEFTKIFTDHVLEKNKNVTLSLIV